MKRTAMIRTGMRQGGGAKGAAKRVAWRARRDAHLAANPYCAAIGVLAGPCKNAYDLDRPDAHHFKGRGMGGVKRDTSPLITLCRKHHDYVEEHREEARVLGLLAPKGWRAAA